MRSRKQLGHCSNVLCCAGGGLLALEIALEYIERLANFSSWEVSAAANDEMPISHTLVGLATAFDFLYNHLTMEQRDKYFK